MTLRTNRIFFVLLLVAALAWPEKAFAETLASKYFDADIHDGVDKLSLLHKLKANKFLHTDISSKNKNSSPDNLLADTLDAIYIEVCDALDIHMYSFKITLAILPDRGFIKDILRPYFKKDINMPSFYSYDKNTIYVSCEELTAGMLAHEVAHAIISHYFVVAPSTKIQEVLAGYAEYSLRKRTGEPIKK